MAADEQHQQLLAKLAPFGQQHVLQFWEELSPTERGEFADQIAKLDLVLIDALHRGEVDQPDWGELSRRAEPPAVVRLAEREGDSVLESRADAARQRGEQALAAGEVGVLLTAGGQGSRLGFDLPKSMYPIGPLSQASLLEIHIAKVRALAKRYGATVPLYLMTSPATHAETVRFLEENQRFGLAESELFVFCQGTMPAVDFQSGKLLLAEKHRLFQSPDGHGGTVAALAAGGALEDMQRRGIQNLFYLQVDNPLVPIGDTELIGYHLLAESELTSVAVAKQRPEDKLGVFANIDGQMHVVEYSDLPDEIAELRDAQGALKIWAGSIAVHVFAVRLFERAQKPEDALPLHTARKPVSHLGPSGKLISPTEANALKFEKFIFDLLPKATNPIVVELAEADCFAPLKNAPDAEKDTPEYVQQMMLAQHRRWLEAAGAHLAPGVDVEISPLFALDAAEVAERIEPGHTFEASQFLSGD